MGHSKTILKIFGTKKKLNNMKRFVISLYLIIIMILIISQLTGCVSPQYKVISEYDYHETPSPFYGSYSFYNPIIVRTPLRKPTIIITQPHRSNFIRRNNGKR